MVEVGTLIGKLRVERVIGRGGMGVVVVATHVQLGQRCAIKIAHEEHASDPSFVERFVREARACASLRSEHSCRVSDVGQLESGAPYIVMELLEGSDLASVIAHRPLEIPVAADYVLQACTALAEAHALGIVHRDLKPSNLFLTKQLDGTPLVKVLDFGIAKAPSSGELELTRTSAMLGSPSYMSPEQLRSPRDVDLRTDIWSLGVILYQLVSGRLPFPAQGITELAVKVTVDPPSPLDVDPNFARIVMRCLEKSPDRRYADVAELAADLLTCAPEGTRSGTLIAMLSRSREPVTEPPGALVDPLAPTTATLSGPPPPEAREPPASPTRRWLGVALAAAGTVALVTAAIVKLSDRDGSELSIELAHSPTSKDAALLVEASSIGLDGPASPDAAVAPLKPVASPADLRAGLRSATQKSDWDTALRIGHQLYQLAQLDDASEEIYTRAMDGFVKQQKPLVDAEARKGDCVQAAAIARKTETFARPDAETEQVVLTCFDAQAAEAYKADKFLEAFTLAKLALQFVATDERALSIAANASCKRGDHVAAQVYIDRIQDRRKRQLAIKVCEVRP